MTAPERRGFPELAYLAWAMARYGRIRFDLAQSGLDPLPASALGDPAEVFAGATDPRAPGRWVEAIARRFAVSPAEVCPAVGATHGLFVAYAALLARGDDVLVESPVYEPLVRAAEALGARVIPFVRDLSRGAALDPDAVARAITARTRLVVFSNLHNPTGAATDDAAILAIAKAAAESSAFVLVDEVYRDLVDFDPERGRTAFGLAPNVVTTSSLTKVYGLPWLRAGWILAPEPIAARARNALLHTTGAISYALASASTVAIERIGELHALSARARANDEAAARRVQAWVAARPNLAFTPHPGSIFGFVEDRRGVDLRPAIERAIEEEQVIVAPGVFFGHPSGFRLRYGAMPFERLDEGLEKLGLVLDEA